MSCPEDLTLDLWFADALTPDMASDVAAHVSVCATCTEQLARWQAERASLREALDLNQDERAYLAKLDLAAPWRTRPAAATHAHLGWLALFGVIAAFLAWTVAAQPVGALLGTANEAGLATVLVTTALGLLLDVGRALLDLSTFPGLSLAQPLLVVLALALLFGQRITSVPHYIQGVRS